MNSTAPAAPRRCPVIDFVELMGKERIRSLKIDLSAITSPLSPSGVDGL